MEKLILEPTKYTPYIFFNPEDHQLEIKGESYPEHTAEFYLPCFNWLQEYLKPLKNQKIYINMDLFYFNSSSSKIFMDFFDILDAAGENNEIFVNWYYDREDDDSMEYGEDFKEDLKAVTFNLIEK